MLGCEVISLILPGKDLSSLRRSGPAFCLSAAGVIGVLPAMTPLALLFLSPFPDDCFGVDFFKVEERAGFFGTALDGVGFAFVVLAIR